MTCMKILHVVAGLPPTGGGLAEVVPRLALEAARLGADATIATVAPAGAALSAAADKAATEGVRIVRFAPAAPRALFFSWELRRGLPDLVRWADVVHVHSNWTFPVWWASHCALRAGKALVMSPHGCLDPVRLAHSAWKKRLAGLLDRRYLQRATAIHATSDAELEWIERYVGKGPRICVIPNGVEMPETLSSAPKPVGRMRQVLYLGRLHPLKGLNFLLDAWRLATSAMPIAQQWQLVITGPDEQGMRQRLQSQAASLGLTDVVFLGPLYGEEKARALADADLVVLPSRSENFGIVVAEALAAGVPVITTKGTPWGEIDGVCGWWVDVNAAAIAHALAAAMQLTDEQRAAMGARGRGLVAAKYQWSTVGHRMTELYQQLADQPR
jgi:glycosyltransferase involved in cell wall biosynthesis